jgi:hypothetical protein
VTAVAADRAVEVPEPPTNEPPPTMPSLELEQLQEAWQRTVLPAVEEKSVPTAAVLKSARPSVLLEDTLTLEFPAAASFHRNLAEEPKNATLLQDALYEVTGRRLGLAFATGEDDEERPAADEAPLDEQGVLDLVKQTFDAKEVEE